MAEEKQSAWLDDGCQDQGWMDEAAERGADDLSFGAALSGEDVAPLDEPEVAQLDMKLYNRAIRFLARRPYGVMELRRRLSRDGCDEQALEHVLARCLEMGYLDDAQFAESFARNRVVHQLYGPARVWRDLRQLDVEKSLIERALSLAWEEVDQMEGARRALRKRYGRTVEKDVPDRREKKRRYDFLCRRGFDYDVVWDVLEGSE
ncbi:MAG: regulatory protein RecX [Magnetococcales bacterium]|nr:regulatory protein RecX [Magnetococcales bacterium]